MKETLEELGIGILTAVFVTGISFTVGGIFSMFENFFSFNLVSICQGAFFTSLFTYLMMVIGDVWGEEIFFWKAIFSLSVLPTMFMTLSWLFAWSYMAWSI